MKRNLGLLITGALLVGGSILVTALSCKEAEKAVDNLRERIKSDKDYREKFSVKFE